MKQVCLHCARQGPAGSLWCQEFGCAAGDKPLLLEAGETLGEITINRLAAVLRTGAVYSAERPLWPGQHPRGTRPPGSQDEAGGGTPALQAVLVKVAYPGLQERLKREAIFLSEAQRRVKGRRAGGSAHPSLPVLLPAHAHADLSAYPYGKVVSGGETFYYEVFAHADGEPLGDLLLQNPQPWYQHAGWLVLAIADAIAYMHASRRLHLCLSPECILVRYDRLGLPRPLLLDLGAVTQAEELERNWQRAFVPPAYVAPEMLAQGHSRLGAFSDVYGLGLLLYEMLAGQPAYPADLRAKNEIYAAIAEAPPVPLERPDLRKLPEIAALAISKDYRRRPQHVVAFARELQASLPVLPREKQPRQVDWRLLAMGLTAAMAIALLLALAISLGSAA